MSQCKGRLAVTVEHDRELQAPEDQGEGSMGQLRFGSVAFVDRQVGRRGSVGVESPSATGEVSVCDHSRRDLGPAVRNRPQWPL